MKHEDEYLWEASGEPDLELEQLEQELDSARWSGDLPELPVQQSRRRAWPLAAAALLFAIWLTSRSHEPAGAGLYNLEHLEGHVELEGKSVAKLKSGQRVNLGERIRTGPKGQATLYIDGLGRLELEERTILAVLDPAAPQTPGSDHWGGSAVSLLSLERGAFRAVIYGDPGAFQVQTPAGLSVDLGCAYRAEVHADGSTHVEVTAGRVAFVGAGRKVTVPAGASMSASVDGPPSTPLFAGAHPLLVEAVERLDRGGALDAVELETLLEAVATRDALTLAHLLRYPSVGQRLFDYLKVNHALPDGVTREGCLAGDGEMIEAWVEWM